MTQKKEQEFLQAVALVILEDRDTWDRFLEGEEVKVPSPEDRARQALSIVIDGKCLAIVDLEGLSAESSIKPETPEDYVVERRTSRLLLGSTIEDIYKAGQIRMKHQIEAKLLLTNYTHPTVALLGKEKEDALGRNVNKEQTEIT